MGVQIPHGKGNFEIVKYRDILRSSVQKRLNQSRCRLGFRNHVLDDGPAVLREVAMATNFGTKIAINRLCVNESD